MLNFFNDYVRFDRGLNYQALKVKENFDKVLDTLGEPDKRDTIISITIRLKVRQIGLLLIMHLTH